MVGHPGSKSEAKRTPLRRRQTIQRTWDSAELRRRREMAALMQRRLVNLLQERLAGAC
jgi:hypothetical protein